MRTSSTLLLALVATAAMVGCDRSDPTARGGDGATVVAGAERQADAVGNDTREAARDARDAAGQTADTLIDKTRDAAITSEINARLARDPDLSALRIDVDTVGGNVVLRGTAPDADARDRATTLAHGVNGVVNVSNELQLRE